MALKKNAAGFAIVTIDVDRLAQEETAAEAAKVKYGFGSKDPHPGSGAIDFTAIDCSGYCRSLLAFASHLELMKARYPDGSYTQALWLIEQGFAVKHITTAQEYAEAIADTATVKQCFHYPNGRGGDKTGHTWLYLRDHPVESCGGCGPTHSMVDNSWELAHCDLVVTIGPLVAAADWVA